MSAFLRLRFRYASLAIACLSLSASAWSQAPLTLQEALRLAVRSAPGLYAADAAARGARESAIVAGELPDPVLRAGIDNLPVTGSDAGSLTRDFMTMRRIGVMQEYVSSTKRALRAERGEREVMRWQAEAQMSRAELRTEVAIAWYDRLYSRRSEMLLQRLADELAMQERAVEAQIANGKASAADALMTRSILVQAKDRVLTARRRAQAATARLGRWLGEDAMRPVDDTAAQPGEEEIAEVAEHELHDLTHLRVLERQVDLADIEVQIAQHDRSPNWTWEVSYAQRGPAYSNMISVGVSVPLPIRRQDRQDRELAARLAQREQVRDLLEDARRRHLADFNAMRIEWHSLRERQRELESALLPVVKQRIDALLAGYASGQQNLASVLEARRAEVDARLQIVELERDAARLWAQLRYTYLDRPGTRG